MHPLLIIMVSAQGHGVHFWCGGTHRTESVTPSDKVIMRLLVSIGDSQLNYPRWGGGILHGPIVLSLVKVNFWMWVGAEECWQMSPGIRRRTLWMLCRGWYARTCGVQTCAVHVEGFLFVPSVCNSLNKWTTLDSKLTTLCKYSYENIGQCKWWSLHILRKCFNIIVIVVYTHL